MNLNHRSIALLLVAALLLTGLVAVNAQGNGPTATVINSLTLREAPFLDAGSVARLDAGAAVTLLAQADHYVYVVAEDGTAGWALPNGLRFEAGQPELPAANAAVKGFANLRILPELTAAVTGRLDPATPVMVVGRTANNQWLHVKTLAGDTAWATAPAFALLDSIDTLPVTTLAADAGVVTRFAVLRAAPDSTSAEVATVPAGTIVTPLLASGDRLFVETADGVQGWAIASAFAFSGNAVPETLVSNAVVSAEVAVNLREGPSLEAATNGAAQPGERLAVIGVSADGQWYRAVPSSRVAAWVFAELVTLDEGVGPLAVVE